MLKYLSIFIICTTYNFCLFSQKINIGFTYNFQNNFSYLSRINIRDGYFAPDNGAEAIIRSNGNHLGLIMAIKFRDRIGIETGFLKDNFDIPFKLSSGFLSPSIKFENPKINLKSYSFPLYLTFKILSGDKYFSDIGIGCKYNFYYLNSFNDFPSNPLLIHTHNPVDTITCYLLTNHLNDYSFLLDLMLSYHYYISQDIIIYLKLGINLGLTPLYSGGAIYYWNQTLNDNIAIFNKGDKINIGLGVYYSFAFKNN